MKGGKTMKRMTTNSILFEINEQDLAAKSGAEKMEGIYTEFMMTLEYRCGWVQSISAECRDNHKPCW